MNDWKLFVNLDKNKKNQMRKFVYRQSYIYPITSAERLDIILNNLSQKEFLNSLKNSLKYIQTIL